MTFLDASAKACRLIRANLELTCFDGRADVLQAFLPADLDRSLAPSERFDGALVDPPYDRGLGVQVLAALAAGDRLTTEAWIIVEHRRGDDLPAECGRFVREALRRYGDTEISLYVGGETK